MILVENPSKLALDHFQESTISRKLGQERKERPNKHDCS